MDQDRYSFWKDVAIALLAYLVLFLLVLLYASWPTDCPDVVVPPYKCPSLECSDCPEPEIVVTVILPHLPKTGKK